MQVRLLEAERDAALFALEFMSTRQTLSRLNLTNLQQDFTDLRQVHYRALHRIITLEAAAHDAAPGDAHHQHIMLMEADLAAARASQAAAEGAAAERAGVLAAAKAALVALQGQRADEAAAVQRQLVCMAERANEAERQLPAALEDLPDLSRVQHLSCIAVVSLGCCPTCFLHVGCSTLHVAAYFIVSILAHQPSAVVHACNADPEFVPMHVRCAGRRCS